MARTRVVVALIVILLIGGGAVFIFLPHLTGDDYLKDFFLQQLEQSIGRKIDVHRIKLVLFPRIRLELTQVAIHDRNSDDVLLSAKKLTWSYGFSRCCASRWWGSGYSSKNRPNASAQS